MPSGIYTRPSAEERFWEKVDKTDTCWLWTACKTADGYGRFAYKRKQRPAHRVAYELIVVPIPKGLTLDHLCRVRHCVNPEHLEAVTQKENVLRGESPSAIHARKTNCKHGHPFSGDNLLIRTGGRRRCRACKKRSSKRWWQRRRATT